MSHRLGRGLRRLLGRALYPVYGPFSALAFRWLRWNREYFSRQLLFDTVMGFVADCRIEGCYMEFGCAHGGSLIDAFDASRRYPRLKEMRFLVFDSFQGLPEPTGLDAGEVCRYEKGQFACDLDRYVRNVRRHGVDVQRLTCIPGWYKDTLNDDLKRKLPVDKAAVIWIDCDLYESTVPVLDFITEYIQDGTVVIFDDWFSYKGRLDRGEARAFHEWLAKNPSLRATEYHKTDRTIVSFLMQKS